MRSLLLKISNEGLYFNPTQHIPWSATNLPQGAFLFQAHTVLFWEVSMENYEAAEQRLRVKVIDYEAVWEARFDHQKPKKDVKRLTFVPLHGPSLKAQLSYYDATRLAAILEAEEEPIKPNIFDRPVDVASPDTPSEKVLHPVPDPASKSKQDLSFDAKINGLTFGLGVITGQQRIEEWDLVVDFRIPNDFIIPEFDHIKPFFAQALGSRKVRVSIRASMVEAVNGALSARSPVLERIDDQLLAVVRAKYTKRFLEQPKRPLPTHELFTAEELYEQYDDDAYPLGEQIRSSAAEIIQQLIDQHNIRNGKQLLYLAGKFQSPKERIRFTLTPLFGFVFTHHTKHYTHYVWELLNSHATYLWSVNKAEYPIGKQWQQLEQNLAYIRQHGRRSYRDNYTADPVFSFHLITHQHAKSLLIDSFPKWRHRLQERLV